MGKIACLHRGIPSTTCTYCAYLTESMCTYCLSVKFWVKVLIAKWNSCVSTWCTWQIKSYFDSEILFKLPGLNLLYLFLFSVWCLNVGFTTRATLNRLLETGDITPQEVQLFQQVALAFLVRAVEYGINKLPLKEPLLKHAKLVDVQQRTECGVEDALYFVHRQGFHIFQNFNILYTLTLILIMATKQIFKQFFTHGALFRFQELLPFHGPEEQDKVSEEFLEYQLMDIPMPQDPTTFNVEEFWGSMSSIKSKVRNIWHHMTHIVNWNHKSKAFE